MNFPGKSWISQKSKALNVVITGQEGSDDLIRNFQSATATLKSVLRNLNNFLDY